MQTGLLISLTNRLRSSYPAEVRVRERRERQSPDLPLISRGSLRQRGQRQKRREVVRHRSVENQRTSRRYPISGFNRPIMSLPFRQLEMRIRSGGARRGGAHHHSRQSEAGGERLEISLTAKFRVRKKCVIPLEIYIKELQINEL